MSNETIEQRVFKVNGIPVAEYFPDAPANHICVTIHCEADLTFAETVDLMEWLKKVTGND